LHPILIFETFIKTLMKVIREIVTWGVTILPLKRNLVPRFMRGGEVIRSEIWLQGIPRSRRWDIKPVGVEESIDLPFSSSLSRKVTEVYMIPLSDFQGWGMTAFQGEGTLE
jgi:hypothetical protein